MKAIVTIITILLFLSPIFAQKKMTDREFGSLKGKVKSVIIEDADLEEKDGKLIEKQTKTQFDAYYDGSGNVTQESNYVIGIRDIFSFVKGSKTSKSVRFQTPNNTYTEFITANPQNKQSKIQDTSYDTIYKYKYNLQGQIIEEQRYGNNRSLILQVTYKYDEKGLKKEDTNSIDHNYTIHKFDNAGNEIETLYLSAKKDDTRNLPNYNFIDYKFDSRGNWIQRTQLTRYKDENGKEIISKAKTSRKIDYYPD